MCYCLPPSKDDCRVKAGLAICAPVTATCGSASIAISLPFFFISKVSGCLADAFGALAQISEKISEDTEQKANTLFCLGAGCCFSCASAAIGTDNLARIVLTASESLSSESSDSISLCPSDVRMERAMSLASLDSMSFSSSDPMER